MSSGKINNSKSMRVSTCTTKTQKPNTMPFFSKPHAVFIQERQLLYSGQRRLPVEW